MTYLEYTGMEGASARVITKAVKALSITSTKFLGVTVTGDIARVLFLDQPSTADQEAVDALIATYNPPAPLVRVKLQKAAQIDDKTRGLITDGFEYGGMEH